jgi:hypothetical protein
MTKLGYLIAGAIFLWLLLGGVSAAAFSRIVQDGEKTYIVDLHGERWDITQARSVGFEPERFQHGIGRHAFTPLDDSYLSEDTSGMDDHHRVIGISDGKAANAYSVSRLWRHETANGFLGGQPVTAAY